MNLRERLMDYSLGNNRGPIRNIFGHHRPGPHLHMAPDPDIPHQHGVGANETSVPDLGRFPVYLPDGHILIDPIEKAAQPA